LIIFLLFIILLLLGIPIAFALLAPSIIAFIFYPELSVKVIDARLANTYMSSTLVAIPMFMFAAQILNRIKITDDIFEFVNKLVGHIRGGLAHVNVIASIIFAGMSGSAAADAAGLGKVEIKAMTDQGYSPAFAAAITAASATIGPIIPPSIAVIVYGAAVEASIGKLLIGGFLPGLIMAICLMAGISIIARRKGMSKRKFAGVGEIRKTLLKAIPGLIAPFVMIGGMLFGLFTPTEAATMSVAYAIILGFVLRTLNFMELWQAFKQTAMESAAMLFMFFGASLIGLLVTRLHVADAAISLISSFTTSPVVLLLIMNIFLLIVGCLMDPICSLILLTPILVPLVQSYGINEIHFGIIMILNLMIGMITPPLGSLMFITSDIAKIKAVDFLKECWPFMIWLIVALMIVTYVPQTVLWLPNLFM
jgi:tripartite ATP-independent transporter DctM subunit